MLKRAAENRERKKRRKARLERRLPEGRAQEAEARNCANTGGTGKKSQPDKGWDFTLWWWDGTPHQTTIESTESKRCGLLQTRANQIEKPAGTAIGRGRSSRFFALIGARKGRSTSSAFRGQFQFGFGNRTRVRRPDQKHTHLHPFEPGVLEGNATALTRQCNCITIKRQPRSAGDCHGCDP